MISVVFIKTLFLPLSMQRLLCKSRRKFLSNFDDAILAKFLFFFDRCIFIDLVGGII